VGEGLREGILLAMEELPEDYRHVLRLVQEEALTLTEAGRRLGRSAGAAEKLYGRALAKLALAIREGESGPGEEGR
jgi:DNA-directed RNA polymerase specialized sigma24 family protein